MKSISAKHSLSAAILGLMIFLAAGSSEEKTTSTGKDTTAKTSSTKSQEVLSVVLSCQNPNHSRDRVVIGIYESKADVIAYSSSGIFDSGTTFNAALTKTEADFYITHPYYGKGFSIDRTSLELYRAKEWSGATSKPFTMADRDNCGIAQVETFEQALSEYKEHIAARKQKEEQELDALKANRKI